MSVDMVIEKNELITYQLVGYQMDVKSAAAVAGVSGWKRSCCCGNESDAVTIKMLPCLE